MTRINISARVPGLRILGSARIGWSGSVLAWMAGAFLVSLLLTAIVLAVRGVEEPGTVLALRATARWCFALFWPAYAGSALAKVCGPRFAAFARHGREFGLAFAAALSVHLALVLWLIRIAADQREPMIFFWSGAFCTYALALLSWPRLRDALGARWWRRYCSLAVENVALVFAADFIIEPLRAGGIGDYPISYWPFAAALAAGACLRWTAFACSSQKPARK